MKQMEKNAEERALRAEQRDQETREMLQHLEQLKLEDLKVRRAERCWGARGGWREISHLVGRVSIPGGSDPGWGDNRRQN